MSESNQSEIKNTSDTPSIPEVEKSKADLGTQSGTEKNPDDGLPEGVKKRIAKLTREKYEFKTQIETLANKVKGLESQYEASQPAKIYESREEEISALVEKELANRERLSEEKKIKDSKTAKYMEKYESTSEHIADIEDFDDVVNSVAMDFNNPVDQDIASFCINSDSGKRLTYEIGSNPELLESLRLASYSVRAKLLMKLDAELYDGISKGKAEKVVEETIDAADAAKTTQKKIVPKLITPVTGKKTPKGNGPLSMKEYMEQRNQRLAAKKR